jgi:four helix bundle protein
MGNREWGIGKRVMGRPDFEDLELYQLAEKLANKIWGFVQKWNFFAKATIDKKIVRAADSVCANIAEERGRYNYQDNQRFIKIARGSLYETISLLSVAYVRQLLTSEQVAELKPIIDELPPKLNAYLNFRRH